MTEHALTDEICKSIAASYPYNGADIDRCEHIEDMRAATDWQLEQVIEWIKSELARGGYLRPEGYSGYEINVDDVLEDLKEAMRPQENN
jgi:hypothetical protein